ncbi:MAG: hypothetical protein RLY71_2802 [Pseudomonadota bacterium]|jgi:hypothetical protein
MNTAYSVLRIVVAFAALLAITGCGGGGDQDEPQASDCYVAGHLADAQTCGVPSMHLPAKPVDGVSR